MREREQGSAVREQRPSEPPDADAQPTRYSISSSGLLSPRMARVSNSSSSCSMRSKASTYSSSTQSSSMARNAGPSRSPVRPLPGDVLGERLERGHRTARAR